VRAHTHTHTHTLSEQLLLSWMLKGTTAGQARLCIDIKGTAIEKDNAYLTLTSVQTL